jgi:hypothetical protein
LQVYCPKALLGGVKCGGLERPRSIREDNIKMDFQ